MENCVFCKIISGEIPCYKIFENDKVFAFLDINPAVEGHTLVVPKKHLVDIFEIDEDYLKELIVVAKNLAEKMKLRFNAEGINIFQSNGEVGEQTIFHFHLHVLPRKNGDGVNFSETLTRNFKKLHRERYEEIRDILAK